jgi:hypothetical protein
MLGDMLKDSPDAFRPDLWRRCEPLGPQLRGEARRSWPALSESDVEDLWADLVADAAQAAGQTGALAADADRWSDAQLAGWLRSGLDRDCNDLHRKRTRSDDGRPWVDGAAGEGPEHPAAGIWTTLSRSPEDQLIDGARFDQRTQDVVELVGDDGLRVLVAEASGIGRHEHGRVLGLTKSRLEDVRGRLEFAAAELRSRGQAAVVWLWPEATIRWVLNVAGFGGSAALSVSGLGKGALATIAAAGVVAAGGTAVVHESREIARPQATLTPVLKPKAGGQRSPVQAVVATAVRRSEQAVAVDRQRSQRRAATAAAAERSKTAAKRKQRAARRSAPQGTSTAAQEFSPGIASAQPAARQSAPVRPAPKVSTGGSSTAANEFLPSGK